MGHWKSGFNFEEKSQRPWFSRQALAMLPSFPCLLHHDIHPKTATKATLHSYHENMHIANIKLLL